MGMTWERSHCKTCDVILQKAFLSLKMQTHGITDDDTVTNSVTNQTKSNVRPRVLLPLVVNKNLTFSLLSNINEQPVGQISNRGHKVRDTDILISNKTY